MTGGHHFNYLKTFWNPELSVELNIARTIIFTTQRLCYDAMSFGMIELYLLSMIVISDRYKFTNIRLVEENIALNEVDWNQNIACISGCGTTLDFR